MPISSVSRHRSRRKDICDWLNTQEDPNFDPNLVLQSKLPGSSDYKDVGYRRISSSVASSLRSCHTNCTGKTSHNEGANSDMLPGLGCGSVSAGETGSISSSVGMIDLDRMERFLVPDVNERGVLTVDLSSIPRQQLECPFKIILECPIDFDFEQETHWIDHSLSHFCSQGQTIQPPTQIRCNWCNRTFEKVSGMSSWTAKMKHTREDHYAYGHRLATSRPDFEFVHYLWQNSMIDNSAYRDWTGKFLLVPKSQSSPSWIERKGRQRTRRLVSQWQNRPGNSLPPTSKTPSYAGKRQVCEVNEENLSKVQKTIAGKFSDLSSTGICRGRSAGLLEQPSIVSKTLRKKTRSPILRQSRQSPGSGSRSRGPSSRPSSSAIESFHNEQQDNTISLNTSSSGKEDNSEAWRPSDLPIKPDFSWKQPHQCQLSPGASECKISAIQRSRPFQLSSRKLSFTSMDDESKPNSSLTGSCDLPLETDVDLSLLATKHSMLATLMREIYLMFNPRWLAAIKACAASSSTDYVENTDRAPTSANRNGSTTRINKGKRKADDQEDESSGNGRKREIEKPLSGSEVDGKPYKYACPFTKYDPKKYCLCGSNDGGPNYQACWSGENSISHLKQHLWRKHAAPIQCHRCWLVMASEDDMTRHANEAIRCDQRDPKRVGIDDKKMRLIKSHYGATWAKIYEILFPGSPVPDNSYVETRLCGLCDNGKVAAESRLLQDLNAVSQATFEEQVRAMIDDELAHLEVDLKGRIAQLATRCQSAFLANFEQAREPSQESSQVESAMVSVTKSYTGEALPFASSLALPDMQISKPKTGCPEPLPVKFDDVWLVDGAPESLEIGSCSCICHLDVLSGKEDHMPPSCESCIDASCDIRTKAAICNTSGNSPYNALEWLQDFENPQ